jgi:hypothetical protein
MGLIVHPPFQARQNGITRSFALSFRQSCCGTLVKPPPTKRPSDISTPTNRLPTAISSVTLRPMWHLISMWMNCWPQNFFFEHFLGTKCHKVILYLHVIRTARHVTFFPGLHFVLMNCTSHFSQSCDIWSIVTFVHLLHFLWCILRPFPHIFWHLSCATFCFHFTTCSSHGYVVCLSQSNRTLVVVRHT